MQRNVNDGRCWPSTLTEYLHIEIYCQIHLLRNVFYYPSVLLVEIVLINQSLYPLGKLNSTTFDIKNNLLEFEVLNKNLMVSD